MKVIERKKLRGLRMNDDEFGPVTEEELDAARVFVPSAAIGDGSGFGLPLRMTSKKDGMMPQICRATNVLKRVDVARGVATLILTVKVEVPVEFYKRHRRDPAFLVDVAGVRGIEKGEGNDV